MSFQALQVVVTLDDELTQKYPAWRAVVSAAADLQTVRERRTASKPVQGLVNAMAVGWQWDVGEAATRRVVNYDAAALSKLAERNSRYLKSTRGRTELTLG